MDPPAPGVPASPRPIEGSVAQERIEQTDGPASDELGVLRAGLMNAKARADGPEPDHRVDKDLLDDIHLERRDTDESCISQFYPQRTNTGWSYAGSTATDLTDLNSPDIVFAGDLEAADSDFEPASSSPRRGAFFPRPTAFQKRLPIRAPPSPSETDKPGGAPGPPNASPEPSVPRHRRLEEIIPRKSSLSKSVSPGPGGPAQTTQRDELRVAEPLLEVDEEDEEEDTRGVTGFDRPVARHLEVEHEEDDAPTPGRTTPDGVGLVGLEASVGTVTPRERLSSISSGISESSAGRGHQQPTSGPGDDLVHSVCDALLSRAFGVELHDLAAVGSASDAYEAVSYCLDELSRIVGNTGRGRTGPAISESTLGDAGQRTIPIWSGGGAWAGGNGGGGGRGNGNSGRKRSSAGHDDSGSGDGAGDRSPGAGKRQKISTAGHQATDLQFSCPFRKRNPVRFNVRESQSCAVQPFPDMPQLKRHVKNFHKQSATLPFTCQRCRCAMGSQKALDDHISVGRDLICDPQAVPSSADPEDGITAGLEEALNGRKAGSKIDSWESLWNLLFPKDHEIPEPDFMPPVELDEVYARLNAGQVEFQLELRIQEALELYSDARTVLNIFRNHLDSVFEACRIRPGGAANHRRRLRVQTSRQLAVRQDTARLIPGRQGSGHSDSSLSSPIATPNSNGVLGGHAELMAAPEVRPHLAPPSPSPSLGYGGTGASGVRSLGMGLSLGGGAPSPGTTSQGGGGQIGKHITAPPALTQVGLGFDGLGQNVGGMAADQFGQLAHLAQQGHSNAPSPFSNQQAAEFRPDLSLDTHNVFANFNFGPSMDDLALQTITGDMQDMQDMQDAQGMRGIQGQVYSPSVIVPAITNTLFRMSETDDEGFEVVRRGSEWM
ncbi:hypothetical protein B0J18DRAFT_82561 [Chaetomium sp. MPI-SDFR-AT-0129]|nr:hypothetical protein B0J18DRAFT_82561 [Chaetomium sp. MPI-SDFR-AT-0129]